MINLENVKYLSHFKNDVSTTLLTEACDFNFYTKLISTLAIRFSFFFSRQTLLLGIVIITKTDDATYRSVHARQINLVDKIQ